MTVCLRHSWCRRAAWADFWRTRVVDAVVCVLVALMSMVAVTILIELMSQHWLKLW